MTKTYLDITLCLKVYMYIILVKVTIENCLKQKCHHFSVSQMFCLYSMSLCTFNYDFHLWVIIWPNFCPWVEWFGGICLCKLFTLPICLNLNKILCLYLLCLFLWKCHISVVTSLGLWPSDPRWPLQGHCVNPNTSFFFPFSFYFFMAVCKSMSVVIY